MHGAAGAGKQDGSGAKGPFVGLVKGKAHVALP